MRWIYPLVLLPLSLGLGSCRNACQDICVEMADLYADCGLSYTQNDVLACFEAYGEPLEEELQSCEEADGQLEDVLAQQSETGDVCDVLEAM